MRLIIIAIFIVVLYIVLSTLNRRRIAIKRRKEHAEIRLIHEAEYRSLQEDYFNAIEANDISQITACGSLFAMSRLVYQEDLDEMYSNALGLLETRPDLKPYALEIGRRKYALSREDGSPTVYDEAAIQNDILAAVQ